MRHPAMTSCGGILPWLLAVTSWRGILRWHPAVTSCCDILPWHPPVTFYGVILLWLTAVTRCCDIVPSFCRDMLLWHLCVMSSVCLLWQPAVTSWCDWLLYHPAVTSCYDILLWQLVVTSSCDNETHLIRNAASKEHNFYQITKCFERWTCGFVWRWTREVPVYTLQSSHRKMTFFFIY